MIPYLDDGDVRLWHGDALDVLRGMDADSVDCVVTSPPYWGLRSYLDDGHDDKPLELGLEPTPDQYVQQLVAVFREVRRVLCAHGTCWVNLGDSYAGSWGNQGRKEERGEQRPINGPMLTPVLDGRYPDKGSNTGATPPGLKPKDLVGIPWRVAFALQQDGWWLRSDIVWSKPNPMPESVTDRPTKAHEYVFLLTKQPRYFFDQEAVREPWGEGTAERYAAGYNASWKRAQEASVTDSRDSGFRGSPEQLLRGLPPETPRGPDGRRKTTVQAGDGSIQHRDGERWPNTGRNVRSVWTIATQPYPEAHFATYPEELVRRCVLAGCPERVCRVCGKASEREYEREFVKTRGNAGPNLREDPTGYDKGAGYEHPLGYGRYDVTAGVLSDCGHNDWRPGRVLDPFVGSGTTCLVARNHGRHSVGIDLNEQYLELAATRLQQLSLLTGEAHASQ